jgi:hypothetical protein
MKVEIKNVTRKARGGTAVKEEFLDSDIILIGRSPACDIRLTDPRVLLEHAQISSRSGGIYLTALSNGSVSVNESLIATRRLDTGDVISIGPYDITVESHMGGDALTVAVEMVEQSDNELESLLSRTNVDIGKVGTTKRVWSWAMFVVFLGALIIWPMVLDLLTPTNQFDIASANREGMEASPTAVWTSGGISAAHKFFGETCSACHEKPFVQVQDSACLTCHQGIENHATPERFPTASLEDVSCQRCHKEHQGDVSVARNDQGFCVDCHGSLTEDEPRTTLRNVFDFGSAHPDFRPSVVVDASLHVISRDAAMSDAVPPEEASGLTFPHDAHLRPQGVRHPARGNIVLDCGSCHIADASEASFLPITFAETCHQCHELTFDTQLPDRELVHGQPDALFKQIADTYDAVAMRGGYEEPEAPAIIRRRPGTALTEAEKAVAENWAQAKTQTILSGRFGRGQCDECHRTFDNRSTGVWVVEPVHINAQWFPKSRFDHLPHGAVECGTCHAAKTSKFSSEVLLPAIEICQSCHGGEDATDRVPSTCITCHGFHFDHQSPMRPELEAAREKTIHRTFSVISPDTAGIKIADATDGAP